ncbi:hypothetical protein K2173_004520 [Erythroxylum novogranatense]|uniref:Nuclear transcription factor Y subunit n=1 Tax=Erythroxylum novogranatense TaxID=1862640 RepID=A0AAV8TJV5_9ROSI|nr:hypothetical protein K2173_004520 [Erythroxylum novogranatense]
MAVQIQNFPKRKLGQPHFSCSIWWTSNEQQNLQPWTNNVSSQVESVVQVNDAKLLDLQLTDMKSSSSLAIGQSHSEVGAVGGTNSQDECVSSGSEESCRKSVEGKMKPLFLLSSSDITFCPSQADYGLSMVSVPYPCADPYFGGLFNPYGPQATIQPPMVTSTRVPLPPDITDDGPIYVNAKQYHGILRRRQSRAKLEAQNKHVKTRKPYLHESRHRHAVNRIRGSGGRFLSKKELQESNNVPSSNKYCGRDTIPLYQKNVTLEFECSRSGTGTGKSSVSRASSSDTSSVSNSDIIMFRRPDNRFSDIPTQVGSACEPNSIAFW